MQLTKDVEFQPGIILVFAPIFFRKAIARKTEATDNNAAVRNICSYACADGKLPASFGIVSRYIC